MKKIFILMITGVMMLSFTGCGLFDTVKEKAVQGLENKLQELNEEEKKEQERQKEESEQKEEKKKPEEKKAEITWKDKDYTFTAQYKLGEKMQTPLKFTRTGKYAYFDYGPDAFVNTLVVEEESGKGTKVYKLFPKSMNASVTVNENGSVNRPSSIEHEFMSGIPGKDLKKVGEEQIIGRTAEKYYYERTIPAFSKEDKPTVVKSTMWIDKETGIALKQEAYSGENTQKYFELTSLEFRTVEPESILPDLSVYKFPENNED